MLRILALILLSSLIAPASADQRADAQRQLEAARQDVAELKKLLEKLQQEKSGVQQQLKKTETEMGDLEGQVRELQRELKDSEQEIRRLDQEKKKLQSARTEQQRLIAIQARAAYQSGRQEYVKLLLNQQNPEKFSRTLTYYDYLSQARLEQLAAFNETLRQLANVEQEILGHQNQLQAQKAELDQRHAQLAEARKERQQALAKLNRDFASRDQRLKARQQEQAELGRVLKTIEETLARQAREAEEARKRALAAQQARPGTPASAPASGPLVSTGAVYGGPFASARGKLPWPVDGRLVARYGTPRGGDARTKWDGVLIGAPAGTQVRAVHGGRVVFADWLRGAGLLVILDHGNGYLSLYGHNQSLLKNAGDVVKAGDPIATVGSSGGQEASALYFAIRQNGRPSDPAQWCRAQG
ncbi:murein hydrolase activator EnvC [Pseudomonas sp. GD03721]|uniref:Murein hydrolase activator EnvC n=1 Tax=Ectopseudomonas oleovorans TaxID=301 RepID=A0AA42Q832_ECTOL|nr:MULTISPECIES: murein hydrolase activator EnvC [Pseudomonas]MDH1338844.1 murein hydrolase activator EnvC [Pseudomonas oleovorans]MDH1441917.1 murein hydrolase activator EnvC [Pseudomonas sp. GD03722]MDH1492120.1 murein hydrolase activator EnvC [Pseudomonas oleovorans]WGG01900.1 murein hydrolase activator EnvC [Pseudomonas sp. GD03721]WGG06068.1 murein hydrolase activator EnvC [Pseudomonas sp. GD03919]